MPGGRSPHISKGFGDSHSLGQSELGKFFPQTAGGAYSEARLGVPATPHGGVRGGGIPPKGGVGGCRRGSPAVLSSHQPQPFFQVPT